MTAHVRYLRYVLLHKLYVFAAGVAIARTCGTPHVRRLGWIRWLWRLLIHDLSKFRPSEWRPYVQMFYGVRLDSTMPDAAEIGRTRKARFDRAWLLHIHRNPHHWQHWLLHEDSGKTLVLLMEAVVADEMVADWMGAGTKILARPTLATCVGETVKWYADNHGRMQLRQQVRDRVEETLMMLAAKYGLASAALQVHAAQQARASIVIPGR